MEEAAAGGLLAGLGLGFILFELALIVLIIVIYWKMYVKAGKPGWAAIIPIYGTLVLLEIAGKPWWYLIMFFIPIANIVFLIMTMNGLSKSFGKDTGFTVGLVLLSPIFMGILAFGSAEYVGPGGAPANDPEVLDQGV